MIVPESKVHSTDMLFLWNMFLKKKNIENVIYKVEFENIIRNKLSYNSGHYININTSYENEIEDI